MWCRVIAAAAVVIERESRHTAAIIVCHQSRLSDRTARVYLRRHRESRVRIITTSTITCVR